MQEQDLKEYYRTIFTLRNCEKVEILTAVPYGKVLRTNDIGSQLIIDLEDGFITTPMIIQKSIELAKKEVVAIESTLVPHITWKNTELDIIMNHKCNHPVDSVCGKCQPEFQGSGG